MARSVKSVFKMGLLVFTFITLASIFNIRKFPTMAETQWQLVVFTFMALIMYLVPVSLVSAELATGWPQTGGVYLWVKEAFGQRWGFTAVWLQWFMMTITFVVALSTIAATLAYVFNPALATNKLFEFLVIVVVWWALTLVNLRGLKTYSWISSTFVVVGMLIPAAVLIIGGLWYVLSGHPVYMTLHPTLKAFIPDFSNINSIVLLTTFVFLFMGVEMSAAHAKEIENVKRNYPLALLIVGVVTVTLSIPGALLVAMIVPNKDMNLLAGVMQAFVEILGTYGWLVAVIALLHVLGGIGEASTWALGPVRSLVATARDGNLPPALQKLNKNGIPANMMFVQAGFITFWAAVSALLPGGVNSAYWILSSLATAVYILMYFFMYAAAIRLRYKHPEVTRPFAVPGGKVGIWVVAGWGIVAMVLLLALSLIRPSQISFSRISPFVYLLGMGVGTLVVLAIPLVIYRLKKPSWKMTGDAILEDRPPMGAARASSGTTPIRK
jgi:amino acid transporter